MLNKIQEIFNKLDSSIPMEDRDAVHRFMVLFLNEFKKGSSDVLPDGPTEAEIMEMLNNIE